MSKWARNRRRILPKGVELVNGRDSLAALNHTIKQGKDEYNSSVIFISNGNASHVWYCKRPRLELKASSVGRGKITHFKLLHNCNPNVAVTPLVNCKEGSLCKGDASDVDVEVITAFYGLTSRPTNFQRTIDFCIEEFHKLEFPTHFCSWNTFILLQKGTKSTA